MKKIYIVVTYTGTNLSKIIKYYTHSEFSHVSISLDKNLKQMYSFGRLDAYNPFIGGFVHEGLDKGAFKRFYKTIANIYSICITDKQYTKIENTIKKFKKNKYKYKFNVIGLFAVSINKKIQFKNSFYCAEFVKYVLETSGIETNLPKIIKPDDFKYLNNIDLIYKGVFKYYKFPNIDKEEKKLNVLYKFLQKFEKTQDK